MNNCHLIIVDEGYEFQAVTKQIEKIIKYNAQGA